MKLNKLISCILFTFLLSGFLYAANSVDNYFTGPVSGSSDNILVIEGTQNVTGTLNVSGTLNATGTTAISGDLTVSTINVTNTATVGTLTDSTASLTAGEITGLLDFTTSSGTVTNTLEAGTLTDGTATITGGSVVCADINTGQGVTEVYAMDQDVETTDDVIFNKLSLTADFNMNSFVVMADSGTVTISSSTVILATKAGAMEIDLPDAATSAGKIFTIKKTDADASIVTLDANGGTIDGADPYTSIDAQYDFVTIISDGTNWHIVAKFIT